MAHNSAPWLLNWLGLYMSPEKREKSKIPLNHWDSHFHIFWGYYMVDDMWREVLCCHMPSFIHYRQSLNTTSVVCRLSREPEAALSHCPVQYMKSYEVPSVSPTYTESYLFVGHFLRGPGLVMVPISRLWRPSPTVVLWPHLHIITGSLSTCFSMKLGDVSGKIRENHGKSWREQRWFYVKTNGIRKNHIVTRLCWFPLGLLFFVSFKQFVATEIQKWQWFC